jgi:RNAse (barnase) inhibitor barstar
MRTIELDASPWRTAANIYNALLPALGAPDWHGRNLNAVIDSAIWGEINGVEPPYTIHIRGEAKASAVVRQELEVIKRCFAESKMEFRATRDKDVGFELEILP